MGRLAYMTCLALGRSPYEAPELSDSAPFGQESSIDQSLDTESYIQRYDSRGHPINPGSRAMARQLRRAKNDILSTVGVVVNKEDERLSIINRKAEKQKVDMIIRENEYGLAIAAMDLGLMFATLWGVISLRARIEVFKSYSHISLLEILKVEKHRFGFLTIFFAGMPAWAISCLVHMCRNYLTEPAFDYLRELSFARQHDRQTRKYMNNAFRGVEAICDGVLFLLAAPIQMFAHLQSLHLVAPRALPTLSSLLPFSQTSPIRFPAIPTQISPQAVFDYGFSVLTNPLIIGYIYAQLRPKVEGKFYGILRRRLPKPDRPDEFSSRAATEEDLDDDLVPGLGPNKRGREVRFENMTLIEEFKDELRRLQSWFTGLLGFGKKDAPELKDDVADSIRQRTAHILREMEDTAEARGETFDPEVLGPFASWRAHQERGLSSPVDGILQRPLPQSRMTDRSRRSETPSPSDLFNLSEIFPDEPPATEVNLGADADAQIRSSQRASSPTQPGQPRSQPVIDVERAIAGRPSRSNTLFSPAMSSPQSSPPTSPRVRASLVHQNAEIVTMQLEVLQRSDRNTGGNQPTSEQPLNDLRNTPTNSSDVHSVPTRGSRQDDRGTPDTDLTHALASDAEFLAALQNDGFTALPSSSVPAPVLPIGSTQNATTAPVIDSSPLHPGRHPLPSRLPLRTTHHRVTALSNHPSDALASHASSLITTALMLPLESLYLRSLASSFLRSPGTRPGAAAATHGLLADVRGVGGIYGGFGSVLGHAGRIFLVLAMQACISTGVWGLGTGLAVWLGRSGFGWGKL